MCGVTYFIMKKNWLLIILLAVLAIVYAIYFTDWFRPKTIHITSINARVSRGPRARNLTADSATVPVIFKLGRPAKLTELKVVVLDEWQTNKNCLPLWHLVASTNSVPIGRPFYYGVSIPGMKPEVPGLRAKPLQPGVKYRLLVRDVSTKGEHDFQPVALREGQ